MTGHNGKAVRDVIFWQEAVNPRYMIRAAVDRPRRANAPQHVSRAGFGKNEEHGARQAAASRANGQLHTASTARYKQESSGTKPRKGRKRGSYTSSSSRRLRKARRRRQRTYLRQCIAQRTTAVSRKVRIRSTTVRRGWGNRPAYAHRTAWSVQGFSYRFKSGDGVKLSKKNDSATF